MYQDLPAHTVDKSPSFWIWLIQEQIGNCLIMAQPWPKSQGKTF